MTDTPSTPSPKVEEAKKLTEAKLKIERLRMLVVQVTNERDIALTTLRRMSMDLQQITDVDAALKDIG